MAHAGIFVGKRNIDLSIDPPPNIVVEIDISRARIDKRAIYAALGIMEFWRYDGTALKGYRLVANGYVEMLNSDALRGLPIAGIDRFLEMRSTLGQSEILRAWQSWLQLYKPDA